jgi:outer membrane receptor protein involved in Fe transport
MAPISVCAQVLAAPAGSDSDPRVTGLEEVVVTAQKRSERLSDVPISVTAASGEQLAAAGVSNPVQLEKIVPGLTVQQSSYGVPVFSIRGIGFLDTAIAASPTVSVYVDQFPLPFSAMTRGAGLDVERVEVLKGPQGTLFGQNSTGGAINYVAAKPTDQFESGFQIEAGRFEQVNLGGYLSGPISSTLSARLAIQSDNRGDWQRSQSRGDTLGKQRYLAGRLLIDWKPSDSVTVELNLNAWRDRSDSQAAQLLQVDPQVPAPNGNPAALAALAGLTPTPLNARAADWNSGLDLTRNDRFYQAGLRADVELGGATLTSLTSVLKLDPDAPTDPDGTAYGDMFVRLTGKLETVAQELRLAGQAGPRLNWMIGGSFQKDIAKETQVNLLQSTNNGVGPFSYAGVDLVNNQEATTWAVFSNGEYKLTDALTLQLGARYTKQDRDFSGCLRDQGRGDLSQAFGLLSAILSGGPPRPVAAGACVTMSDVTFAPVPGPVPSALNEDNLSWRASLNWKADDDTLLYGNITKGYKSGSYPTLPAVLASQLQPVTQESVTAYEIGLKRAAFGRTLNLSSSIFHYEYTDKQILGYVPVLIFGNLPVLVNIPKSHVTGAEVELSWHPNESFRMSAGLTYVDSRVDVDPKNPIDPFGKSKSFVGEAFPNTPKWQGKIDAEYRWSISDLADAYVGGNVSGRSSSYANFGKAPSFRLRDYVLLDVRTGVEFSDGRWGIELWGRNVSNELYWNNVAHLIDTVTRTTGLPATYGVTLRFRQR